MKINQMCGALVLAALISACGFEETVAVNPAADAGTTTDGGTTTPDAGTQTDAGTLVTINIGAGVSEIKANSAKVQWVAGEQLAEVTAEYRLVGSGTVFPFSVKGTTAGSGGSIDLPNLEGNKAYEGRVTGKGVSGANASTTNLYSFTTLNTVDAAPPNISADNLSPSSSGVTIIWTSSEPVTEVRVDYKKGGLDPAITVQGNASTNQIVLSGLEAGTGYTYKVVARDLAQNVGQSTERGFITTGSQTQPAPTITVFHDAISTSSALIHWVTAVPLSDVVVKYGTDPSNLNLAKSATANSSVGQILLDTLAADTTYSYKVEGRVSATTPWGSSAVSSFKTGTPVANAPVITVQHQSVSANSANVIWVSTKPLSSVSMQFRTAGGPTTTVVGSVASPSGGSVDLAGLTAGTQYFYKALGRSTENVDGSSPEQTFTTATTPGGGTDTVPPLLLASHGSVGQSTATISWQSNEALVSASVEYWVTATSVSRQTVTVTNATSGTISLVNLTSNTTFNYRVVGTDAAGNSGQTSAFGVATGTFTTAAAGGDTTPPQIIATNGTAAQSTVTVSWGATEPLSEVKVEYGTSGQFNLSQTGSVTNPQSGTIALSGLSPSTVYNYRVVGKDLASNSGTSATGTVTTAAVTGSDTTNPTLVSTHGSITAVSAVVTWVASEPLQAVKVEYGVGGVYNLTATGSVSNPQTGTVILAGLSASTGYNYRVVGTDLAGLTGTFQGLPFTTLAAAGGGSDTTAPTLTSHAVTALQNSATVTGQANESLQFVRFEYWPGTVRPSSPTQVTATSLTSSATAFSFQVAGLTTGTQYSYTLTPVDLAGNSGSGTSSTFTTTVVDPAAPPSFTSTAITAAGTNSIAASWAANEVLAFVRIEYWAGTGSRPSNPNIVFGTANSTTGSIPVTGLATGTMYSYILVGTDLSGLSGQSTQGTFTNLGGSGSGGGTTTPVAGNIVFRCKNPTDLCTVQVFNPLLPLVNANNSHYDEKVGGVPVSIDTVCGGLMQNAPVNEPVHVQSFSFGPSLNKIWNRDNNEAVQPDGTVVRLDYAQAPYGGATTASREAFGCYTKFGYPRPQG